MNFQPCNRFVPRRPVQKNQDAAYKERPDVSNENWLCGIAIID
jgi:hypothetical protein